MISEEAFGPGSFSDQNKTNYTLVGKEGYINGENELKAICSIFGYGKGAVRSTSITAQDVLDITGYDPSSPKYNAGEWGAYGSTVTYTRGSGDALSSVSTEKNSLNNNLAWSGTKSKFSYFDGASYVPLTSGSIDITSTYYYHDFTTDPSDNSSLVDSDGMFVPKYELLFGKQQFDSSYNLNRNFTGATSLSYWLASCYVETGVHSVDWGVRILRNSGIGGYGLIASDGFFARERLWYPPYGYSTVWNPIRME